MTVLLGLSHALPPSADVGGVRRPILAERGGASDLALEPARQALARAGIDAADVEFIIFATMTGDVTFPGSACFLQNKLGAPTVGALDIRGQCCGFLMGLMIADSFLAAGAYRNVLLAAAEVHSSGLDYSERGAAVARLYGDGGAAALLGPSNGNAGLRSVVCHTDGRRYDRFWCEYPASRQHPVRITVENFRAGKHFPSIDFDVVRSFGRNHLPAVIREALGAAAIDAAAVDVFIVSHVLPEVVEEAGRALNLPREKVINATQRHGHLTAAALPVALDEAMAEGRLTRGSTVCLAACGAGFTWGAAVLTL